MMEYVIQEARTNMIIQVLMTILAALLVSVLPSIELVLHALLYFKGLKNKSETSHNKLLRKPLVSILIPVKNEPEELFERSLKSIANLNWPKDKIEVIIISDDPPRKASVLRDRIEKISREVGLHTIFINRIKPRGGRSGALNDGLRIANGKYVMTLDVDNIIDQELFEEAISLLENKNYSAVVARWKPLNTDTRVSQAQAYALDYLMDALYRGFQGLNLPVFPLGSGTIYRRDVLLRMGGWDEERIQDDMEIGSRLIGKGYTTGFVDKYGVYVELPPTVKALKVQQSRWSYGAMDALITRFLYLIKAPVPLYARFLYIAFLLQYTPVVGFMLGLSILFVAAYFMLINNLIFIVLASLSTVLAILYIYSFISSHVMRGRKLKDTIVMLGRSSALVTLLAPWITFYTLKALFRIPYKYRITPKGKEAFKRSSSQTDYSKIVVVLVLILSLTAYLVLLMRNHYVFVNMPYLLLAIAVMYSLLRWWKEI